MTQAAETARLMDTVYRHQRHFYDLTRKFYLLGRDRLIRELQPPRGGVVLELGCGTGIATVPLAARGAHITAVDDVDGPVAVVCTPDDSSPFPVGTTPVTCTATDACGNVATVMFNVVVLELQDSPLERLADGISLRGNAAPAAAA